MLLDRLGPSYPRRMLAYRQIDPSVSGREPVLKLQSVDLVELTLVVGHEDQIGGEGVARDEGVERADRSAGVFEGGADAAVGFGGDVADGCRSPCRTKRGAVRPRPRCADVAQRGDTAHRGEPRRSGCVLFYSVGLSGLAGASRFASFCRILPRWRISASL
jgi:hypothetical protein